jgi:hypothetical protein
MHGPDEFAVAEIFPSLILRPKDVFYRTAPEDSSTKSKAAGAIQSHPQQESAVKAGSSHLSDRGAGSVLNSSVNTAPGRVAQPNDGRTQRQVAYPGTRRLRFAP